jgi:hypothetical protein
MSDNFSEKLKIRLIDNIKEVSLNPESVIEFNKILKHIKNIDKNNL